MQKRIPNVVFVYGFDNCVIRNTKGVGIMWRKCQFKRKILVGRVGIVIWRSRYLVEVQAYGDNGHLMFYTHKTWTDSNLTFCKCWWECEVIGIHTHVNWGNRLIMLHIGGIGGFLALCIYKARWKAIDYHGQMNATNFKNWRAKKITWNFLPQPVIVLDNSPYHYLQVDRPFFQLA